MNTVHSSIDSHSNSFEMELLIVSEKPIQQLKPWTLNIQFRSHSLTHSLPFVLIECKVTPPVSRFLIVGCSHHPVVTPKVVRKSFIPRGRPFLIGQRPRVWRRLIPWFAGMGNRRRANNPVSWKTKQNRQTKIKTEKSKNKLYGCFPTL